MRRSLLLALVPCLGVLGWIALAPRAGRAQADAGKLPGARPTIEAIDYPSLQAALDALPPEGGIVRLPAGTFEIGEPLTLAGKQDVLIQGAGTATHIRNTNTAGKPALVLGPADFGDNPKDRVWRIALKDFRVTGNPESGHGILAQGVNELYVAGISVSEHGGDGIRLVACYEDPRIVNNLLTYNKGTGLALVACHDIVVAANQFEENLDAVQCTDSFNLCMTGNCVDDHLGNGVVIANTYGSVVSGNMIEECRGTAIILERDCYGITLSANVIAHESADGIDLRDAHGCTVTGNTFTIVQRHALVIGPDSARITVTGNNFSDSTTGPEGQRRLEGDRQAGGVVLRGTSDIVLDGNIFAGVRPRAVAVEGEVSRVIFTDNVLTDVESDHDALDGVVGDNLEP